ncbi:hypothetical protein CBER1_11444 [Cercospora berteroae]|uniref:DUF6536 domain-containing protein n=1 Tax=Cercospora berteroae TaxID=357750 RepID=A0A2S6BZ94_9PEZI|nr:hypothetical protein CBER1_11444 [Cercospora berteroae]
MGLTADSSLVDNDPGASHKKTRKFAAWKVTVFDGIGVATFVLTTNVVALVWAKAKFPLDNGIATAYTGSCTTSRKITIWVDLAINVLSTLLLAASNNCAQILSSPTRADIARAHGRMKWLDTGVPSVRNLGTIPIWRSCLWILLFASSIPLHLMYNSSIFSSRQSHNYNAFAVTEDFQNVDISHASDWISEPILQTAGVLQRNFSSLTRMGNAECLRNYTQPQFLTNWHNLLIVTNARLPTGETIANAYSGNWTTTRGSAEWPCTGSAATLNAIHTDTAKESCSILINTTLVWIVIICNAIKILCLGVTTCIRNFTPLVNIGDAIESFLTNPEQDTARLGPVSASDVRKGRLASRKHVEYTRTVRVGRSRANVASRTRWTFCVIVCIMLLVLGLGLVMLGTGGNRVWTFGTLNPNNLVEFSLGLSVTTNVILANVPQVAISFAYIFYNNIMTCMVMAGEFAKFASTRKPLRVSRPRGAQRSTFWLSLPYRYSVPMLVASALLHWAIARSLFFVKIDVKDPNGNLITSAANAENGDYASGYTGCAYSPGAALAALALWIAFIATLIFYSIKRLHPSIPVAASCSRALSAASHCPRTDVDAAILPLQYGIFVEEDDDTLYEKVGFSSESVEPHNRCLPYYEYMSGPQRSKAVTETHLLNRYSGRDEHTGRWMVPSDQSLLLNPQHSQSHAARYASARRELEEDFRQRLGPYGGSSQASSVQIQDEVELTPSYSPLAEGSGKRNAYPLNHFVIVNGQRVFNYR